MPSYTWPDPRHLAGDTDQPGDDNDDDDDAGQLQISVTEID